MTLWFKLVLLVWGFKLESSRSNSIFHSWKPQGLRLQKCKRNNLRRKNKIHSHKSKQTSPTLAHPRSKKKTQSFLTRTPPPPPPPPCVYISIYIYNYIIYYILYHTSYIMALFAAEIFRWFPIPVSLTLSPTEAQRSAAMSIRRTVPGLQRTTYHLGL